MRIIIVIDSPLDNKSICFTIPFLLNSNVRPLSQFITKFVLSILFSVKFSSNSSLLNPFSHNSKMVDYILLGIQFFLWTVEKNVSNYSSKFSCHSIYHFSPPFLKCFLPNLSTQALLAFEYDNLLWYNDFIL